MEKLKALDMMGRSYALELQNGEQLHFKCQACYFDELTGFDQEMNRRRLHVSDIITARRKGKVYGKVIIDLIEV